MILVRRLLPYLLGLLEVALFLWQAGHAEAYPWIVLLAVVAVPVASFLIAWGRLKLLDLVEKMTPTFLLVLALAFGLLLAEGTWPVWTIALLAGVATFMSLELLFLLSYDPSSYPVNALSRVNIAYVPFTVWYALSTSAGLLIFLHSNPVIHIAIAMALGAILFRTTGHPGATPQQNTIWTLVGILVGLEIGWIGLLLPVSMQMQGLVGALLVIGALRVRRYLYEPRPGRAMAWTEIAVLSLCLLASLSTAKWI